MGIPPERVTLLGESSGTPIAVEAAKMCPVGRVVLISTVGLGNPWPSGTPLPEHVLAFHGENDPIASPDDARQECARVFGTDFLDRHGNGLVVFPAEGHQFRVSGTWARILDDLVANAD
jgi:predicted esterase